MPGTSVPQGLWLPPRVATLLVAANDALDRTRAQADYLCDGVADDVQINAALNALPAANGRVVLSEGTFTLAAPIVIPGHYIVLEGQGWTTFIDGDGLATGEHGIVISAMSGCAVKNLRIQTENGGDKTSHCIFIENGANEFLIERVYFMDSDSDAIHIEGTSINKGWILGNFIEGADDNGIFVDMGAGDIITNLIISENYIASCGVDGIRFWNTGGPEEHCEIVNNIIGACVGCGMYIRNALYFAINDNIMDTNGSYGLRLQAVLSSIIEDNVSYRNTLTGIQLEGSTWNTVSGNSCIANDRLDTGLEMGIWVDGDSPENQIVGNICYGNHGRGMNITGPRCSIIGNQCNMNDRCGMYISGLDTQVNNNHIYDNGQDAAGTYHGIELGGAAHRCQVNDNHISSPGDSQEDGIHLDAGVNYVQIVGNYCYNGMGDGIALGGNNDYCLLKANYCLENDGYGIDIPADTCVENTVKNNKLEGNTLSAINDLGTDTRLPEIVIDAPNPDSNIGDFPAQSMLDLVDTEIRMKLHCPSDFQELVRAHIVLVPGGDGDLRRAINTDFGKICAGQFYNTHSASIAVGQVAELTLNKLECIDIAAALDGIAAGDWIGIWFERQASHALDTIDATVWVLGLRMQYV